MIAIITGQLLGMTKGPGRSGLGLCENVNAPRHVIEKMNAEC